MSKFKLLEGRKVYSSCECEVIERFPDYCPNCRIWELERNNTNLLKQNMKQLKTICQFGERIKELEAKFIKHKVAYRNYIMRGDRIKELEKKAALVKDIPIGELRLIINAYHREFMEKEDDGN